MSSIFDNKSGNCSLIKSVLNKNPWSYSADFLPKSKINIELLFPSQPETIVLPVYLPSLVKGSMEKTCISSGTFDITFRTLSMPPSSPEIIVKALISDESISKSL